MPIGDWQFWVVTGIALVAAWAIARKVWAMVRPMLRKHRGDVRRASLTISAKGGGDKGGAG